MPSPNRRAYDPAYTASIVAARRIRREDHHKKVAEALKSIMTLMIAHYPDSIILSAHGGRLYFAGGDAKFNILDRKFFERVGALKDHEGFGWFIFL